MIILDARCMEQKKEAVSHVRLYIPAVERKLMYRNILRGKRGAADGRQ